MPCFVCAYSAGEPEVQTDSVQIKTNEPSSSAKSVESNSSSMQSAKLSVFISAAEISPLPKASENVRRRQRQTPTTGKPTVLTASPYKQYGTYKNHSASRKPMLLPQNTEVLLGNLLASLKNPKSRRWTEK